MSASVIDLADSIERVIDERNALRKQVRYAETSLMLIRECAADEKIRAMAAGAVETLKEMAP